jgi:hypothetical protein
MDATKAATRLADAERTIRRLRGNLQDLGAIECPCGYWHGRQYVCNACGYDRSDPDAKPPKRKAAKP